MLNRLVKHLKDSILVMSRPYLELILEETIQVVSFSLLSALFNFSFLTLLSLSLFSFFPFSSLSCCLLGEAERALAEARKTQVIILALGIGRTQEREGIDRTQITLPGRQQEFALEILKLVCI